MCSPSPELSEQLCGSFFNPNYVTNYTCLGWSFPQEKLLNIKKKEAYYEHLLRECRSFSQRPKGDGKAGMSLTVVMVIITHAVIEHYHDDNDDAQLAGARGPS